ncbi:(Fe-S)-binding protein [Thermodesulfobacteriota bacterium]
MEDTYNKGTHDLKTPQQEKKTPSLLSIEQVANIEEAIKKNLNRRDLFMMNACVHCGICAKACHYYQSTSDPNLMPAMKLVTLRDTLRDHFGIISGSIRILRKRKPLDTRSLDKLFTAAFEECTLCGRCAITCPMGINVGKLMFTARTLLCSVQQLPSGLVDPVKAALSIGNFISMSTEDFVDSIEWIAEEMEDDVNEKGFSIPIDKKDKEVLYIPHPLEVRDFPFLLMNAITILHTAGEDYTFSSYGFDTVNYAYHQGNPDSMVQMVNRVLKARETLRAKKIVLAPCGHGYKVLRWDSEKHLGRSHPFPILTIVEQTANYLSAGRIKFEKDKIEGPVTFHDPCNIARCGGIIDPPRNILRALTSHFVEMEPHGALNYCCGGGGGLASTTAYRWHRIAMGKAKAEQIRKTGAKIVATSCFNCMTQIRDLNQEYDLGIEVKSIVELAANSLKR